MKKIAVVTGGAGFIGSHTVDLLLKKKYKVRVIDNFSSGHKKNLNHHSNNKNLDLIKLNILEKNKLNKIFKDVDHVFHFAGVGDIVPSIENPSYYIANNVIGTLNILEACKTSKIKKFVYAASSSCYGIATVPTKENHPINTLYPYAISKYQGEQLALHWSKVYKIPTNSIRIFNAYGPRVRTTGAYGAVFGVFFKQKLSNKNLTVVGNGKQKRDFIYVTDLANAFYKVANIRQTSQIYNVGAGKPVSINKLVNLIGGNITYIPKRPGEPDITWANITKIMRDAKWKPKISFDIGVKRMLKNINDWQDAPLWDVDSINEATKTWFKFMK